MNYIDAHVHVWNQDLEKYPYDANFDPATVKPATFFPEEIIAHGKESGVDRIVLVQMNHYGTDNSYMLDVMRQYEGVFSGIGVIDDTVAKPDEEMVRLAQQGVRGFRLYPLQQSPGVERMFAAGADHNLAMCLLIGPDDLAATSRYCERFPDTPVTIDHICRIGVGPGPIEEAHVDQLCALAQYPRVMVKLSAFYVLGEAKPPYDDLSELIRRVYEAFGAQRLMWASDCPYQVQGEHTYAASVDLIRERLDFLSAEDKDYILRDTAQAFFF